MKFSILVLLLISSAQGFASVSDSSTSSEGGSEEHYAPIPELNYVAPKAVNNSSMFDEVRLHAGAAFIDSFQNIGIGNGQRVSGGVQGAEVNFGADLFSQNWILEGALFSIPQTTLGTAQISSNGFELRLVYETAIFEGVTIRGDLGIADRNYGVKSSNGDNSLTSGATVVGFGMDYWPVAYLSLGLGISDHIAMSNGDDPSSIDLAIKVNGHF
jgi:hypothetical protein